MQEMIPPDPEFERAQAVLISVSKKGNRTENVAGVILSGLYYETTPTSHHAELLYPNLRRSGWWYRVEYITRQGRKMTVNRWEWEITPSHT